LKSGSKLKKYLFRERMIKAILNETETKKDWISLRSICYKYDLPYFRARNFLLRMVRNGFFILYHDPFAVKHEILFLFVEEGRNRLKEELKYAQI